MNKDLPTRLRLPITLQEVAVPEVFDLLVEAADEIERLRANAALAELGLTQAEPVATSCADHFPGETGYATFHARVPSGAKLYAAPQPQAAPAGEWVMVPREPTLAMLGAGRAKARDGYTLEAAWGAMLAAAPDRGGA